MVRKVVATEGTVILARTFLNPGCLKPREGDIPLVWPSGAGVASIARDFERNKDTGEISFDIEPQDGLDLDLFDPSPYCINLVEERSGEMRVILEATIVQLYLVPIAAIPRSFSRNLQGP